MPAAAVIPAPIAYIKVVAVKKLVVEFRVSGAPASLRGHGDPPRLRASFTVKKLECLKQALGLNTLAWNNEIGPSRILLVARFGND